jgi:AICAR transformylase/IMP cyclohydrolase PurH
MLNNNILNKAKKLYNDFKEYIKNADNDEEIIDLCEKKSNYRVVNILHNDYSMLDEDKIVINIVTNNTKENSLQGIKIYIDIDNLKLSKYIDIFLVNDEYPCEMIEIEA